MTDAFGACRWYKEGHGYCAGQLNHEGPHEYPPPRERTYTQDEMDAAVAEAVRDKLQAMFDTAEMSGDPYKIFGLLKDELQIAQAKVRAGRQP